MNQKKVKQLRKDLKEIGIDWRNKTRDGGQPSGHQRYNFAKSIYNQEKRK